jgi:hypothetical protein
MNEIRIRDQWCAAYLLVNGCTLVGIVEELESSYLNYIFEDHSGVARAALASWRAGTSTVQTLRFIQAYKAIKRATWCHYHDQNQTSEDVADDPYKRAS